MGTYVSEICAEGIFVTFPWWPENVESRSKIVFFSNERHFEIWFPKKRTIMFFWSKLSKLHKKRPNFACGNYIFPKTGGNKNKPWTHSASLNAQCACEIKCCMHRSNFACIRTCVHRLIQTLSVLSASENTIMFGYAFKKLATYYKNF